MNSLIDFFCNNMLSIIPIILSIIGGLFALIQWHSANRTNHAEYVDHLLQRMGEDEAIHSFLFIIDYEEAWYNRDFHDDHQHVIASKADKAFFFFNYLCYLNEMKLISKKDLAIFEYYLITVAQCQETASYFLDLYQFTLTTGKKFPFVNYLDYCISRGVIPKRIKDKNYYMYLLMLESEKNGNSSGTVPQDIIEADRSFGSNLYIPTCSRCEHCCNYQAENSRCEKMLDCEAYRYCKVSVHCESFIFDKTKWKDPQK